ncbi:MAG: ABC transporter permease [Flavobacteriaceae bacterium]
MSAAPPIAKRRRWTTARIAGWTAMTLWIAAGFGAVWMMVSGFEPDFFRRYAPRMLGGFGITLTLTFTSVLCGAILALPVAFCRRSGGGIAYAAATAYTSFFRGTPLLAQTFLVYYGAGQFRESLEAVGLWGFFASPINCALLTFTLNTAAYQSEIFRGAVDAVPRGQREAGMALGLPRRAIFLRLVAPQAMILALRPFGNEVILMLKGSAIASVITVFDLMGETKLAFARSFDFQVYLWAAFIYLSTVEILRRFWDVAERRLTRHLRPRPA